MTFNRHPCTTEELLKHLTRQACLKTHRISSTLEDFQPCRTTTCHNCICAKSTTTCINVYEEI